MSMSEMFSKIQELGRSWGLTEEDARGQGVKLLEECEETNSALGIYLSAKRSLADKLIFSDDFDVLDIEEIENSIIELRKKLQLEIGDAIVVCTNLLGILDIDLEETLDLVYDKISKRKGTKFINSFVKAEDFENVYSDVYSEDLDFDEFLLWYNDLDNKDFDSIKHCLDNFREVKLVGNNV